MHTTAIYRLLYGSDFIGESLASIYPHVDHILCFVGHDAFGGRRVIRYFNHDVYLPYDIDGLSDAIGGWKKAHDPDNKVHVIPNRFATLLKGQLTRMINEEVVPRHPDTTHVLFVEADEVWHEQSIRDLLAIAADPANQSIDEFMVTQNMLFWRSPRYVSSRENPYAVLRALKGRKQIGLTGHALAENPQSKLKQLRDPRIKLHNFGYAASERTIFWKHIIALSVGRDLDLDSAPREGWFEDVWRPWNWHTNRRTDLCPSKGYETAFPAAQEYPFDDLPSLMRRRLFDAPLPEWVEPAADHVKEHA